MMRTIYWVVMITIVIYISGCSDDSTPSDRLPPTGEIEVCPDLSGQELIECIVSEYSPSTTYTYNVARDHMYSNVDIWDDGLIHTIYSDYTIMVDANGSLPPRTKAFNLGVNTEHIFPRSMGAGEEPAISDMFHLFPCQDHINSARGNLPYAEIDDVDTEDWYYLDQWLSSIPSQNIDDYTEGTDNEWEPREEVKGDVARAVFYFYTIHNDVANESYYESMKNDLLVWHNLDPADDRERQRNERIRALQGNDNPFIINSELAGRLVDN